MYLFVRMANSNLEYWNTLYGEQMEAVGFRP